MTLRNGLQCGLCIALTFLLGGGPVLADEEAWCTESTSGSVPAEYYLAGQTGTCASRQVSGNHWECCHNFTKAYTNGMGGWAYVTSKVYADYKRCHNGTTWVDGSYSAPPWSGLINCTTYP